MLNYAKYSLIGIVILILAGIVYALTEPTEQ